MDRELEMRKETVEISGGRNLYNYRFYLDGEELPPMKPEDEVRSDDEKESREA
jgi:hypothetical protein